MPRGDQLTAAQVTAKLMILGDPKAGKTEYALKAAEAGFNVLYLDGDVAAQTLTAVSPAARSRIFYMDVGDRLDSGIDPRMIQIVADFFTSSKFLWNDTKQAVYSRMKDDHDPETGACLDEIWEIRPARFDNRWVLVLDSWTTLSYSAMLAKGLDMGVDLGDIEKADMNLYAGAGNRLTNMLATIQKAKCHFIVIGHPAQFEKTKSPDNQRAGEIKAKDRIVEWTKMVPKSSSNPHGLTMGKYFSDIGWIDVDKFGKRKLDFDTTNQRVSGGHMTGKGDPRGEYSFANVVKHIGGAIPEPSDDLGEGLTIHLPGTFIPASKPVAANPLAKKASTPLNDAGAKPTTVKGLGGLAGLKNK